MGHSTSRNSVLAANRISVKRACSLAYIADLLMRSQEGAKREAGRWKQDLPTFKAWLKLKYVKGHPKYPEDEEEGEEAEPKEVEAEVEAKSEG
jgi:hypothetical protein